MVRLSQDQILTAAVAAMAGQFIDDVFNIDQTELRFEWVLTEAVKAISESFGIRRFNQISFSYDAQQRLLFALVLMVIRYLPQNGDERLTLMMSAGEQAIEALVAFGLMTQTDYTAGKWTAAGIGYLKNIGAQQ